MQDSATVSIGSVIQKFVFWLKNSYSVCFKIPLFVILFIVKWIRIGDKSIGNLLLVAFQTRYKEVLIKAHTVSSALTPKFLSLLTKEETKCEI